MVRGKMKKFLIISISVLSLNIAYGMDELDKMERGRAEAPASVPSKGITGDIEDGAWLLFPKDELPEKFAKMGKIKRMLLEFSPLPLSALLADICFNLEYKDNAGQERYDQMLVGYAYGKESLLFTREISFPAKILGGTLVWGAAAGISVLTKSNLAVLGYGALLYVARAIFSWYAQKTGRATEDTAEFSEVPAALQRALLEELKDASGQETSDQLADG
jgi:hypothetical protein